MKLNNTNEDKALSILVTNKLREKYKPVPYNMEKESVSEYLARGGIPSQHKMGETAIDPNIGIPKTKAARYYKSARNGAIRKKNERKV